VLQKELYTFGGPGVPDLSRSGNSGEPLVVSARQRSEDLLKTALAKKRRKF
jgi:hypothetical protein